MRFCSLGRAAKPWGLGFRASGLGFRVHIDLEAGHAVRLLTYPDFLATQLKSDFEASKPPKSESQVPKELARIRLCMIYQEGLLRANEVAEWWRDPYLPGCIGILSSSKNNISSSDGTNDKS